MVYYAVKKGRQPGIYNTWGECSEQIKGYKSSSFKKFNTLSEATNFIKVDNTILIDPIQMWTDGSAYYGKSAGYAFLFVDHNDKLLGEEYGSIKKGFTSDNAEIIAIIEGLRMYHKMQTKTGIMINSDCEYIVNTVNDWGENWKDWSGKQTLHSLYKYIKSNPRIQIRHVPAHVGLKYNERCDCLAKKGANI
jgi:ribonuclease HI